MKCRRTDRYVAAATAAAALAPATFAAALFNTNPDSHLHKWVCICARVWVHVCVCK